MTKATKILASAAVAGLLATGFTAWPEANRMQATEQPAVAMASAQPDGDHGTAPLPSLAPGSLPHCPGACDWASVFRGR